LCGLFSCIFTAAGFGQASELLLLQQPTLSRTHIAFAYASDIWIVGRGGGETHRLTTGDGINDRPFFSPDGATIAFTGNYDGNTDVYTISASGDSLKRLTHHPGPDSTTGWTPDGKCVLF